MFAQKTRAFVASNIDNMRAQMVSVLEQPYITNRQALRMAYGDTEFDTVNAAVDYFNPGTINYVELKIDENTSVACQLGTSARFPSPKRPKVVDKTTAVGAAIMEFAQDAERVATDWALVSYVWKNLAESYEEPIVRLFFPGMVALLRDAGLSSEADKYATAVTPRSIPSIPDYMRDACRKATKTLARFALVEPSPIDTSDKERVRLSLNIYRTIELAPGVRIDVR